VGRLARDTRLLTDVRRLLERWAPWIAGAVLVAGVAAFALTRLTGGGSTAASASVPLDPQAKAVAREFVATAVARKHLAAAWAIAAPQLRHGMTLAQWRTGTIPVQPYPVTKAQATYAVQSSIRDAAVLRVTFTPPPASSTQPGDYLISLVKDGGRWRVSAWTPRSLLGAHG
jgi:hypothetical protein